MRFFSSDHRALFLDINLQKFLHDLNHITSLNTSPLSTQSPDSTIIYEEKSNKFITKHNIINQVNTIQYKWTPKQYQNLIVPTSMKLINL